MSTGDEFQQENDPDITVKDEEGTVDRKTKEHILNLRKQIDDDERRLYVELRAGQERGLAPMEADQYWGISVRQYLRGIKRLWDSEAKENQIKKVEYYWEQKPIGKAKLIPPDKDGYQFSRVVHNDYSDRQLRRMLDLPRTAEIPVPEEFTFVGLNEILNTVRMDATWAVTVDASGPPANHEILHLQRTQPVPKHILEEAVEVADNFLQQAGIGFETTVEPYMGEGGPGL